MPDEGRANMDRKIVDALSKVSQVLRTLAWKKSVEQSINPIQLQILIFLLNHQEQQARVSLLAKEFNISKASISDTITLLKNKELVEKVYDVQSSGSFMIRLNANGRMKASEASLFDEALLCSVSKLNGPDKEQLFSSLSQILLHLYNANVINQLRMCQNCQHHQMDGTLHYCKLLQRLIHVTQLQIDCPEHLTQR